jgi:hypothetical protein
MMEPSNPAVAAALRDPRRIDEAMRRAALEAVTQHVQAGRSIPVGKDGQVSWLTPAEVLAYLGKQTNNPAA